MDWKKYRGHLNQIRILGGPYPFIIWSLVALNFLVQLVMLVALAFSIKVRFSSMTTWVLMTCPPNPDPPTMRVPSAAGCGPETLDHEADTAFGGTDRDQAA